MSTILDQSGAPVLDQSGNPLCDQSGCSPAAALSVSPRIVSRVAVIPVRSGAKAGP
jgi:hypothetical protein